MARFLFAWELGGYLGHLACDAPVAAQLRARGHTVLFALNDLGAGQRMLVPHGIGFIQAPVSKPQETPDLESRNYGDLLRHVGFHESVTLRSMMAHWHNLMALFEPDLIVADHAPSALLAARMANLPAAQLATGFTLPPFEKPLPVIRPWLDERAGKRREDERVFLTNINVLLREAGRPILKALFELYDTELPLILSFPELDYFADRRAGVRHTGAVFELDQGDTAEWPAGGNGRRVFAYLRADTHLDFLLAGLRMSGASVIACIPGANAGVLARHAETRIRSVTQPLALRPVLRRAHAAVTPSGVGITSACLSLGVPVVGIPVTAEAFYTASSVTRLGAGMAVGLAIPDIAGRLATALDTVMHDREIATAVKAFHKKHAGYRVSNTVNAIADALESVAVPRVKAMRSVEKPRRGAR